MSGCVGPSWCLARDVTFAASPYDCYGGWWAAAASNRAGYRSPRRRETPSVVVSRQSLRSVHGTANRVSGFAGSAAKA